MPTVTPPTIAIEPSFSNGVLTTRLRVSRELRPLLRALEFEFRYEEDICADEGLLSVPGIAQMLPLAWITGADIRVGRVDHNFARTADALQNEFKRIYPKAPFRTRLIADEVVESPPNPPGSAMLFSGGLDATYSFFANSELRPRLIQVLGTDIDLRHRGYATLAEQAGSAFAKRHGVEISFIRTTALQTFDVWRVGHLWGRYRERLDGDLWKGMGYALGHLAMAAPLSAGRFDRLILGAWADRERADEMGEYPDASSPAVDRHIGWTNLGVEHHGCLHRHEKAIAMREWLPGNQLRVCWAPVTLGGDHRGLNCSRCEKCARSITALAVAGVDPQDCGFSIDADTIAYMKRLLTTEGQRNPSRFAFFWKPLQQAIPEHVEEEMNGLRGFLDWLRHADLGDGVERKPRPWSVGELYYRFPFPVAKAIRTAVYGVIGEPERG